MITSPLLPSTLPPTSGPETEHALRSFGHVEVLRIKRRSRKQPELMLFKGSPGSKHSSVRSALITLVKPGEGMPTDHFDREAERIHLYYADAEDPELQALLADPGAYMCYFWTSFDSAHSHAWLLSTR